MQNEVQKLNHSSEVLQNELLRIKEMYELSLQRRVRFTLSRDSLLQEREIRAKKEQQETVMLDDQEVPFNQNQKPKHVKGEEKVFLK